MTLSASLTDLSATEPMPDKNILPFQTCIPPNYAEHHLGGADRRGRE